jgi:transglutaminase-like putative cysteine protease/predicted glutamine amidotransferase
MSKLLALSFDAPASPSITLRAARASSGHHYGWGMAWYPPGDKSTLVVKDPTTLGENAMTHLLRDWSRFRSTTFVCHLRGAAQRISQDDTHPFVRTYAGREWVLTHNGQLDHGYDQHLTLPTDGMLEPVGHTDTEHVLCWLLERLRGLGIRRLADMDWAWLHGWFQLANEQGTGNFLFTDGESLVAYQDQSGFNPLHWQRRLPPHTELELSNDEVELSLSGALDTYRTALLVATEPLRSSTRSTWQRLEPGAMLVVRRGEVVWASGPIVGTTASTAVSLEGSGELPSDAGAAPRQIDAPLSLVRSHVAGVGDRLYRVRHTTTYDYGSAVEQSQHFLRLRPVHDSAQQVLAHRVSLEPAGSQDIFEDVFGNHAMELHLERPFDRMRIEAESLVAVASLSSGVQQSRARRMTIPMDWMPWQRQMMMPYLLPPELPESQLRELFIYAMSFVERQDYDLVETLEDINRTIHRDYAYVQGVTTLATTPFDVYAHRRGVCQDFANLFICLARLLGLPARYRVGYIYTGADYANKLQSEASHAWVEVYLPWAGWRGFDPTNGCLAGVDHVRVACGRNYRDATPTSGTIYRGGAGERLHVEVLVEEVASEALAGLLAGFEAG